MQNYERLSLLGEGTFGIVMKCRSRMTGDLVAIKKHGFAGDSDDWMDETLKGEIALVKQCNHDNVVKLLDVIRQDGDLYSVFELLDRCVVDDLMIVGPLEPDIVGRYTFQLARAVHYLHSNNILHRDIKTENMLVSQNGVVKLCDFGFAVMFRGAEPLSCDVGTPLYVAPEILLDDESYGTPVDVWAIGITILAMATGNDFISGNDSMEQLNDIITKVGPLTEHQMQRYIRNTINDPPAAQPSTNLMKKYNGLFSDPLADLVEACLQMDPSKRCSCSEILEHHYFTENHFLQRFNKELVEMIRLDEVAYFNQKMEEKKEEEEMEEDKEKQEKGEAGEEKKKEEEKNEEKGNGEGVAKEKDRKEEQGKKKKQKGGKGIKSFFKNTQHLFSRTFRCGRKRSSSMLGGVMMGGGAGCSSLSHRQLLSKKHTAPFKALRKAQSSKYSTVPPTALHPTSPHPAPPTAFHDMH